MYNMLSNDNTYVQFLGFSCDPERPPEGERMELEQRYAGRTFKADQLPEEFAEHFELRGDVLIYRADNTPVFRFVWKRSGGVRFKPERWTPLTRYTHEKTPRKFYRKWSKDLPWITNNKTMQELEDV